MGPCGKTMCEFVQWPDGEIVLPGHVATFTQVGPREKKLKMYLPGLHLALQREKESLAMRPAFWTFL